MRRPDPPFHGKRLDWSHLSFYRSIATIDGPVPVSLQVLREVKDDLPFEWIASGFSSSKEAAFDRAERAGIAAATNLLRGTAMTRELYRLAVNGQAFLIVNGHRDTGMLIPVLQMALRAVTEAEHERDTGHRDRIDAGQAPSRPMAQPRQSGAGR